MPIKWLIYKTGEFEKWMNALDIRHRIALESRLRIIETEGYIGNSKALKDGLFELKWNDGMRVYYCFYKKQIILLLFGGFKYGQGKDIEKARKLKKAYAPHTP